MREMTLKYAPRPAVRDRRDLRSDGMIPGVCFPTNACAAMSSCRAMTKTTGRMGRTVHDPCGPSGSGPADCASGVGSGVSGRPFRRGRGSPPARWTCSVTMSGFFLRDPKGEVYGTFSRLQSGLADGERLVLAMNAGMFHEDLRPVGLYIEDGIEEMWLVTSDGARQFRPSAERGSLHLGGRRGRHRKPPVRRGGPFLPFRDAVGTHAGDRRRVGTRGSGRTAPA